MSTVGLRSGWYGWPQRLRLPWCIASLPQFYARSLAEQRRPDDVEATWRPAERLAATPAPCARRGVQPVQRADHDRLRWLAVTLCLFHDARLTDFWRLYELLQARMAGRCRKNRRPPPATAGAAPAPLPSLFADNDADLLLAVHGEVVTVEERLEAGVAQVRRVRF